MSRTPEDAKNLAAEHVLSKLGISMEGKKVRINYNVRVATVQKTLNLHWAGHAVIVGLSLFIGNILLYRIWNFLGV